METYDNLKLTGEKSIIKLLDSGEYVIFSAHVFKFNEVNKRQERTLLVTNLHIYNLSKLSVKRKISIKKVFAITISQLGSEFVVHVPEEYDYRYATPDHRDQAVLSILRARGQIPIFIKDELALTPYTTTKIDKKKGVNRLPNTGGEQMNEDIYRNKIQNDAQGRLEMRAKTNTLFATKKGEQVTIDDFTLIKVLGRGAYGKVMLVEKKDDKQVYAMKSIRKEDVADPEQLEHTKTERLVLEHVNHPFLVNLIYAFQTPEKIFFVTQFMRGGELFQHLKNVKRFDEARTKYYVAEIALALEHLHSKNIIYRDLKPENVLMDEVGHVCLTDFGMAKILRKNELALSFCGTPEYLAPEILQETGHSMAADWWALGIFTFEMLFALPPFYSKNQDLMFKNIQIKEVQIPQNPTITAEAKDFILKVSFDYFLIAKLLIKDPKQRLGSQKGPEEIRNHPWFKNIVWDKLLKKEIEPPFKPPISGDAWVDNFDKQFTEEQPINSYAPVSDLVDQEEYKGFEFSK